MKPIPYGRQHITDGDIQAVIDSLTSDYLTQGPKIEEFEKAFAKYIGVKYAVAVSNGTAALHLGALALGVTKTSNVITTPLTFVASANGIRYCEGNIYFSDIDLVSYTLDLNKTEDLIRSKPKGFFTGIVPVDFAGFAVNLEELKKLAIQHNLWIMEDACHAPGGFFRDSQNNRQNCGNANFADVGIFSFHPVKHIACGEGGMITTNNEAIYKKLMLLRTHGITKNPEWMKENRGSWYYEMIELGFNYRLTDIQAALGLSQLSRADEGILVRRRIAARYAKAFANAGFIEGQSGLHEGHAYHLYVIRVRERDQLYEFLRSKNVFAQIHYIPVHLQPYYTNLGWGKGDFPVVESYYEECISLPIFPSLTEEEQEFVINSILDFYKTK